MTGISNVTCLHPPNIHLENGLKKTENKIILSSRNRILTAVAENQPPDVRLTETQQFNLLSDDLVETFTNVLIRAAGRIVLVDSVVEIQTYLSQRFQNCRRVTTIPDLREVAELLTTTSILPGELADVECAVIYAKFAVAENGAVWFTDEEISDRVLPFICQHLLVVVNATDILPNMHAAYEIINNHDYGYGTFIAGPSKTADIEQSLVLGAHGPKSMTIFLIDKIAHDGIQ